MTIYAGIDVGSLTAECVLLGESGLVASSRQAVRPHPVDSGAAVLDEALGRARLARSAITRT